MGFWGGSAIQPVEEIDYRQDREMYSIPDIKSVSPGVTHCVEGYRSWRTMASEGTGRRGRVLFAATRVNGNRVHRRALAKVNESMMKEYFCIFLCLGFRSYC